MKSFFIKTFILSMSLMLAAGPTWAMCMPFWPPDRVFEPEGNMEVLVTHDGSTEHMVVQPRFRTNAEDFGMILPVPTRPTITEAPEGIFGLLENITNPHRPMPLAAMALSDSAEVGGRRDTGVYIIDFTQAGDYNATTVAARSTGELTSWLASAGFDYDSATVDSLAWYVERGYYFVLLRINTQAATLDENGFVVGSLSPLDIAFSTTRPMVPMRIMRRGSFEPMSMTLYTYANTQYVIPGTEIQYANRVQLPGVQCFVAPCFTEYDRYGGPGHLTRHRVSVTPGLINNDLYFTPMSNPITILPHQTGARQVLPTSFDASTGISRSGVPVYGSSIDNDGHYPTLLSSTRLLRRGTQGEDVRDLQRFINNEVLLPHETDLALDGQWGPLTNAKVRLFQQRFGIRVDGIVGGETRAMMRSYLANQDVVFI